MAALLSISRKNKVSVCAATAAEVGVHSAGASVGTLGLAPAPPLPVSEPPSASVPPVPPLESVPPVPPVPPLPTLLPPVRPLSMSRTVTLRLLTIMVGTIGSATRQQVGVVEGGRAVVSLHEVPAHTSRPYMLRPAAVEKFTVKVKKSSLRQSL